MVLKMAPSKNYYLIGAGSGWGAKKRGCADGPRSLIEAGLESHLTRSGMEILGTHLFEISSQHPISSPIEALPYVEEAIGSVAFVVKKALSHSYFPLVIGGDHSIAVGTWSAFETPIGLIWIDAHMDSHTETTTPSGAYHGMPLAALLGYGKLAVSNPLNPSHVVLIGVRSFEAEEAALLKSLGVRVYLKDEVKKRGFGTLLQEVLTSMHQRVPLYGVSLDLDVFSPDLVPGVGSPEPDGIDPEELIPLLALFKNDPKFAGFELVEFNPHLDKNNQTQDVVFKLLGEL